MTKRQNTFKDIIMLIMFTAGFIISLCFIGSVKAAVLEAIKSCIYGIVPSLFAVCVLCGWAAEYGIFERAFAKSRINPSVICVFILGNIGGYPIGAKTLCDLTKKGRLTAAEAECALCFSFSPGPAFCLGAVSPVVFKNSTLGWCAYFAILLANLLLFIFYRKRFSKGNSNTSPSASSFSDCLTSSVSSAAYSMISICSAILFFSAVSAVIKELIPAISGENIIYALMEISSVTKLTYKGLSSFVIITVVLAFGGLCVFMQIKSLIGKSYSIKQFIKTRCIHIGLSALIGGTFYTIAKKYIAASAKEYTFAFSPTESILPFICILGMMAISITYRKNQRKVK